MTLCKENNCSSCCKKPMVFLLNDDVNQAMKNGYYDAFFVDEYEGIKMIRKRNSGVCVFHDVKSCTCELGDYRPLYCKLRPYIISKDEDKPVPDPSCRYTDKVDDGSEQQKQLEDFIKKLQEEIEWRRRTGYF